jgi:hypothetical protein
LHALPDIADRLGKGESGTLSPTFIRVRVTTLFPSWPAIFVNHYPWAERVLKEAWLDNGNQS